jgi:hypothetical protein
MEMHNWTFDLNTLQEILDDAKDMIVKHMILEKLITEEEGINFAATHTFMVKSKSKISKWLTRMFKNQITDEEYHMYIVDVVDIRVPKNTDNKNILSLVKNDDQKDEA